MLYKELDHVAEYELFPDVSDGKGPPEGGCQAAAVVLHYPPHCQHLLSNKCIITKEEVENDILSRL